MAITTTDHIFCDDEDCISSWEELEARLQTALEDLAEALEAEETVKLNNEALQEMVDDLQEQRGELEAEKWNLLHDLSAAAAKEQAWLLERVNNLASIRRAAQVGQLLST